MKALAVAIALVGLVGCKELDPLYCQQHDCSGDGGAGGGGGDFVIGGTVSGLGTASGLVLQNNGGDDKQVGTDGKFRFATPVAPDSPYLVTVETQPTNPSEKCTVSNGSGTATADVTSVDVSCMTQTYTVGGNIIGLASGTIMLSDGTDSITAGEGMFMFPAVPSGTMYTVQVTSTGTTCTVIGGTGTVGNAPVTSVVVNCSTNMFAIGGTIANLNGTVTLLDNGGDATPVSANGTFAFPTLLPANATYAVTIPPEDQPMYPPVSQNCVVSNGTGTVNGNVQTVMVTCTSNSFSVGGSSTGVTANVQLVDNGNTADIQTVTPSMMTFLFGTPVQSGQTYAVTVYSEPVTLGCTVTNGSSTMANAAVSNVMVACSYKNPGVKCGGSECSGGSPDCCDPTGRPSCVSGSSSCRYQLLLPCDDNADCSGGKTCCALQHSHSHGYDYVESVSCSSSCSNSGDIVLCDPNASGECTGGTHCNPYSLLSGYYACQ